MADFLWSLQTYKDKAFRPYNLHQPTLPSLPPSFIPPLSIKQSTQTQTHSLPTLPITMFFANSLTLLTAALAVGVNALVVPSTDSGVVARCPSGNCPTDGSGSSIDISTGIKVVADVDTVVRGLNVGELTYLNTYVGLYASVQTDLSATVTSVTSIGLGLYSWGADDLASLCTALDAYIAGNVDTTLAIWTKAAIDLSSFTVAEATILKAFIVTCIQADVDLTLDLKTKIVAIAHDSIVVAGCTYVSLVAKVNTYLKALASVVSSLKLDVATATCISAVASLKLALKTYVATCTGSSAGLLGAITNLTLKVTLGVLATIIDAWIALKLNTISTVTAGFLGINLTSSTDLSICSSIVAWLGKNGFDFVSSLNLDSSLYLGIFSA